MMLITFQRSRRHARPAGFSLIEMILTIVITGILAGVVAVFIAKPVEGYVSTVRRGDLTDNADLVLRRISREVSLALPNSLRITETGSGGTAITYIEFIATSGGGAYLSELAATSGTNPLNYSDKTTLCTAANVNKCWFDVVGPMPSNPAINPDDYIVVYNLGQDANGNSYAPVDAYQCGATVLADCNMAKVLSVAGSTVKLSPTSDTTSVFANQSPPLPSPSNRFHVVPGSIRAITYACPTYSAAPPTAVGFLYRYVNYGIFATPALSISNLANRATMAGNASCTAIYTPAASQRNALLTITLRLRDTSDQESVTLMREIHLDNSP